jgi:hypothetical protein
MMNVVAVEAVLAAAGIDIADLLEGKECCEKEGRRRLYIKKIDYFRLLITSLYTHISPIRTCQGKRQMPRENISYKSIYDLI